MRTEFSWLSARELGHACMTVRNTELKTNFFSIKSTLQKQKVVHTLDCQSESSDLPPEYLDTLVQVRFDQELNYLLHTLANQETVMNCGSFLGGLSEH